ncbi:MAG TPA: class I SAM-dependent methyltransferase [Pyrinomonadaceae bacterium]|jgi:SAM-dependent methyltransferase|nr:class I SAM-dependent methyltransferase [Pyrinomonadaceae bacterium]
MPQADPSLEINEDKMNEFLGKVVGDLGASLSSVLGFIGQKLGLYKALADSDGMTSAELASSTGTTERYVREWLVNQASGGYVHYDPASGKYSMLPEQAVALTDETSPFYVGGGFYVVKAMMNAQPRITEFFKNGGGMLWGEHDEDLFVGTEKFFRPGYTAHLVNSWIPAMTGVDEKLQAGGKVADVGCGHGASTIIMAKHYPNSRFFGYDTHERSIETAGKKAEEAGVADRVTFEVANASEIPNEQFDLICFFDCLHDMGDPIGAMRGAAQALAPGGSCMIVEPMAGNTVEENFNIIGRTFSGASTLCCTSNSLAQGGPALGAVATEDAIKDVAVKGGFTDFRRATETPFNRIFEARLE